MPLIQGKSDKAFGKNVSAEMHAGKPQKQSLAIAYAVKRRNAAKKAFGGMTGTHRNEMSEHEMEGQDMEMDAAKMCAHGGPSMCAGGCYDKGGHVTSMHVPMHNPKLAASKMAMGGMASMEQDEAMHSNGAYPKAKRMAEGGVVEEAEEDDNHLDMQQKENDMDPRGWNLDVAENQDDFNEANEPQMEQVHNEIDNPAGESEQESGPMSKPMKSRLLSKILGAIRQAHVGTTTMPRF